MSRDRIGVNSGKVPQWVNGMLYHWLHRWSTSGRWTRCQNPQWIKTLRGGHTNLATKPDFLLLGSSVVRGLPWHPELFVPLLSAWEYPFRVSGPSLLFLEHFLHLCVQLLRAQILDNLSIVKNILFLPILSGKCLSSVLAYAVWSS